MDAVVSSLAVYLTWFLLFLQVNNKKYSQTCFLHCPRCQVVVGLIMDMKALGRPSFIHLDTEKVKEQAAQLPEDGVPPEVIEIIKEEVGNDDGPMDSELQPQKAATPSDAPVQAAEEAGATFAAQRPHAVLAEGRSRQAAHEAAEVALADLATDLKPRLPGLQTLEVRAGNQLLDMFRPCFWSVAFCFLFKHATAEPDVTNHVKEGQAEQTLSRRQQQNKEAPKVDMKAWAAAMQRQVASQFRRDWNFSPAVWNYLFRTLVNLRPNAYMYTVHDADGGGRRQMTNTEIQAAAVELTSQLHQGMYVDTTGARKAVKGDLRSIRHVPGLSAPALKLLDNVEERCKNIPGTHGVRTTMRHQTHAYRVNYGMALFITFSPSERDSALMVKMSRVRQGDPAIATDDCKQFYTRDSPRLEEYFKLSPERLAEAGPRHLIITHKK